MIFLGREAKISDDYFCIGEAKIISKKHARIYWDEAELCFKIENLSKNKIFVNQK